MMLIWNEMIIICQPRQIRTIRLVATARVRADWRSYFVSLKPEKKSTISSALIPLAVTSLHIRNKTAGKKNRYQLYATLLNSVEFLSILNIVFYIQFLSCVPSVIQLLTVAHRLYKRNPRNTLMTWIQVSYYLFCLKKKGDNQAVCAKQVLCAIIINVPLRLECEGRPEYMHSINIGFLSEKIKKNKKTRRDIDYKNHNGKQKMK